MSTVHALLFFGGITLLVIIIVWVLISVRAAATARRRTTDTSWQAEPEWFSGEEIDPARTRRQIEAAAHAQTPGAAKSGEQTGGASATW